MTKLLEVLQYGDNDIRFNTDIDVTKHPDSILDITANSLLAMITTLWGGNESSVIAVIRALGSADIAASIDPDVTLRLYKHSSRVVRNILEKTVENSRRNGIDVQFFGPGVKPSGIFN